MRERRKLRSDDSEWTEVEVQAPRESEALCSLLDALGDKQRSRLCRSDGGDSWSWLSVCC